MSEQEKEIGEVVEEISEDVLDGEYTFDEKDTDEVAEELVLQPVIEIEPSKKPFSERTDIEFDTFYYGNKLSCGLIEVRKRSPRDIMLSKWHDRVIWYEGNIMINSEGRKIAYHVVHEPSANELYPDYFYPTTRWNISRALLSEQDNVPNWKRMVSMKTIQGQEPEPFRVVAPGSTSTTVNAFHFVLVNRAYRPSEQDGKKVDGMFVLSPPASGTYIKSYRDAIKIMNGSPIGHSRQRAADSVAIIA